MSPDLMMTFVLVALLLGSAGDYYYSNSFPHAIGGGLGFAFTLLLMFWILGAFRSVR